MTPTCRRPLWAALGLLALTAGTLAAVPGPRDDPKPAAPPPQLDRVPRDCAGFVTVRLADLWKTPVGRAVRDAVARQKDNPIAAFEKTFGLAVNDLERVTLLVPGLTSPRAS